MISISRLKHIYPMQSKLAEAWVLDPRSFRWVLNVMHSDGYYAWKLVPAEHHFRRIFPSGAESLPSKAVHKLEEALYHAQEVLDPTGIAIDLGKA